MVSQLIFYGVFSLIPIYVLIESSGFAEGSFSASGGPASFPSGIAWFMLGLIILQIVRVVMHGLEQAKKDTEEKDESLLSIPIVFWSLFKGTPGFFMLGTIVYSVLVPILGFVLSSTLFLIASGAFLMYKADGQIVLKSLLIRSAVFFVFAFGLFQLFMRGMRIYLPTGIFGF